MKRFMILALSVVLVLWLGGVAGASVWYEISFTGADIWNMSADNASQAAWQQAAPRRYNTFDANGDYVINATTYGVNGPTASTAANLGFNAWAAGAGSTFAFQSINLWGAGGSAALYWGETYQSVGTPGPDYGVSSWKLVSAPPGWQSSIVEGGQGYSASPTQAFPYWTYGTGTALSQANKDDPSFVWTYMVDIANPETAIVDGKIAVWFGGFSDDLNGTGPDNYEVAGVMYLTPIPEPTTILVWGLLGVAVVGFRAWRRRRAA